MNRIVRDHYPAEKLPEDLRAGLPIGAQVQVTILVEPPQKSTEDVLAMIDAYRATRQETVRTVEDAVAEIRALRDEWDH
jgi:hypothetical protein